MAEVGVAAHWRYKSGGQDEDGRAQQRAREWLRKLLDMQRRAGNPVEFLESVKIDLFPTKFTCSPRAARSSNCRVAPRPWISPTPSIPMSATPALARAWIVGWCRCVPRYQPVRPSRDHYHSDRPTQSGLAQFRGDRQGPRQHSPLSKTPATR
jgi:hypothetical protein